MKHLRTVLPLVFGTFLVACAGPAQAGTVYVSATNGNDVYTGSSWALAKATIQAGVDAATTGDTVLVSDGTYNSGGRVPPGQVLCQARVVIDKAVCVSSVNGPSNTVIVGEGPRGDTGVRCVWITTDASLTGFTLTNGHTRTGIGGADEDGGGVYSVVSSVISNCLFLDCAANNGGGSYRGNLCNCTLTDNSAQGVGGGTYNGTLNNCTLTGNSADADGGAANYSTLNNCTLMNNSASSDGGGAANYSTLNSCTLKSNSASSKGGGADSCWLNSCTLTKNSAAMGGGASSCALDDCTLTSNSSSSSGGGAYYCALNNCKLMGNSAYNGGGACAGTLNNCTFMGNSARSDGGGANGGTLNNCTLSGNTNGGIYSATARNTISYNNTGYEMNGVAASFCYTNDPLFINATVGNLRLQSNSPCINSGFNGFAPTNVTPYDLDGNPRIAQLTVDKGAYEFQGTTFFDLLAASGPNGSISPSGTIRTNQGVDVAFVMLPAAYYHVECVATNGTSVGALTNFTWQNVSAPGTITVSFAATTAALGTPHWWLAQYGWTQNFDTVEAADQDGDGLFTWQEYIAGTCPTNANTDGDQFDDGVEVRAGADPLRDDSQTYAAILSHPDSFGLYTSNSVMDLSYGEVMLNVVSNTIRVRLRMQVTYDLAGNNWTNLGDAVEWVYPLSTNKQFFRFLGGPGN